MNARRLEMLSRWGQDGLSPKGLEQEVLQNWIVVFGSTYGTFRVDQDRRTGRRGLSIGIAHSAGYHSLTELSSQLHTISVTIEGLRAQLRARLHSFSLFRGRDPVVWTATADGQG